MVRHLESILVSGELLCGGDNVCLEVKILFNWWRECVVGGGRIMQ